MDTKQGHSRPFCYPETIKADGLQRQNTVIRTLFAIQRQWSSMARRDKTWSSVPCLPSRDNQVRWRVETNMVIHTIFAIQRQSSRMVPGDRTWSHIAFFLFRENQVRWHVEAKDGHPYLFFIPETIKSDGTQRKNMVIHTFLSINGQ